jgi:tetratricopeptide (TPR) repeat protein
MPKTRLELLEEAAAKDAKNAFARYGLAMELARLGRLEDAARAFEALATDLPDYVPTYFQAGKNLERLERRDAARDVYARGAAAATRAGNQHAREELEAALALLG